MDLDPVVTNPEHYRVVFENERVRVLAYDDLPGAVTTPHEHPDSVMVTLTAFSRHLSSGGAERDVELPAGLATWLPAQQHSGHNTGATPTRVLLVELKEGRAAPSTADASVLGPV